jgi:hypothetical protein
MPNCDPPPGLPLDLFLRAAELESQLPRVLAEAREQIRLCRELCLRSEGLRLELQGRRRALEESLPGALRPNPHSPSGGPR